MPSPNEDFSSYMNCYYQRFDGNTNIMGTLIFSGTSNTLRRVLTTSSVKTANFKKLKPRQLPINDYSKSVIVMSDPARKWTAVINGYPETPTSSKSKYYYDGNCQSKGCSFDVNLSAEDPSRGALMKLLNSISDTKVNTLVAMGEINKTAAHVAKTATRIYGSVRALRHGDFRGFTESLGITTTVRERRRFDKKLLKAKNLDGTNRFASRSYMAERAESRATSFLSETWLEYSYGWKPLLKDVYDHAKALAELSIERQNVVRFAKGKHHTKLSYKKDDIGALVNLETMFQHLDDERWAEYGISFKLQNGELNTFMQLGIDNPLEVVWELIPLSFVADWFIPVGEFLRSLTATNGLVFHSGYKATRDVRKVEAGFFGNGRRNVSGGTIYGPLVGQGVMTKFWMNQVRTKLIAFPVPTMPTFNDPRSVKDGGLKRATSAIALLQSAFLKQKATGSKYL